VDTSKWYTAPAPAIYRSFPLFPTAITLPLVRLGNLPVRAFHPVPSLKYPTPSDAELSTVVKTPVIHISLFPDTAVSVTAPSRSAELSPNYVSDSMSHISK